MIDHLVYGLGFLVGAGLLYARAVTLLRRTRVKIRLRRVCRHWPD